MPSRRSERLRVIPCNVMDANGFIESVHRHHGPVPTGPGGYRFCIATVDEGGTVRGVATVGRPVAANRMTNGDLIAEVSRLATDGCPNACSVLYAAAARAAKAIGCIRIITYILESETGVSLRAAGWQQDPGSYGGMGWSTHPRPGHGKGSDLGPKGRWRKDLNPAPTPSPRFPTGSNTVDTQVTMDFGV